jgi:hypothetical protein
MASISLDNAWKETSAFVKREGALLFPVALLLIAIPFALMFQLVPEELRRGMVMPSEHQVAASLSAGTLLGVLLAMVIAIIGGLTLYALALRPGISVAEALQLAVRRLPVTLGISLLLGAALVLPLALVMSVAPMLVPVVMITLALIWSVRFVMLNAVIVDRQAGLIDTVRHSWTLSKGNFWRIFAFVLIMLVLTMLAQVVAQMLLGVIGYVIAGEAGGHAASDLGTALVTGVAQIYSTVMIARIYRQLSA